MIQAFKEYFQYKLLMLANRVATAQGWTLCRLTTVGTDQYIERKDGTLFALKRVKGRK